MFQYLSRPRAALMLLALGALAILGACGSDEPVRWDARSIAEAASDAPIEVRHANSSIGVGPTRVVLVLINREDGTLVADAEVEATFYRIEGEPDAVLDDEDAEPATAEEFATVAMIPRSIDLSEEHDEPGAALAPGQQHQIGNTAPRDNRPSIPAHEGDVTTVYTGMVDFDQPGTWGVLMDATLPDGTEYSDLQYRFEVIEETPEPDLGERPPASEQATLAEVGGDTSKVSSATEPIEEMLDQTVAEVLQSGRPAVIAFVTPAFCTTRFCGPVLQTVVTPAWRQYGDRVEFVHIEPYDLEALRDRGQYIAVETVTEWGLQSEPFLFILNSEGVITAKLEGITDLTELVRAIEDVLP